jgi:hypothetical protein
MDAWDEIRFRELSMGWEAHERRGPSESRSREYEQMLNCEWGRRRQVHVWHSRQGAAIITSNQGKSPDTVIPWRTNTVLRLHTPKNAMHARDFFQKPEAAS